MPTLDEVLGSYMDFTQKQFVYLNEQRAWAVGSVDDVNSYTAGGVIGGGGYYPMTDINGTVYYLPSIDAILDGVSGGGGGKIAGIYNSVSDMKAGQIDVIDIGSIVLLRGGTEVDDGYEGTYYITTDAPDFEDDYFNVPSDSAGYWYIREDLPSPLPQTQAAFGKIDRAVDEVNMLCIIDSNGTGSSISASPDANTAFPFDMGPTLLIKRIAAKYPGRQVEYQRILNTHNGDATDEWEAAQVVQAGAAPTIRLWNFAIGGAVQRTPMGGWTDIIFGNPARRFDLIYVGYGTNMQVPGVDTEHVYSLTIHEIMALLRMKAPQTPVVWIMQCQRTPTPEWEPRFSAALRKASPAYGFGIIPVNEIFNAQADPTNFLLPDEIHHNAVGAMLSEATIYTYSRYDPDLPVAVSQQPPNPKPIFVDNFGDWAKGAAVPTGWVAAFATATKDPGYPGQGSYSLKLTATAGGVAQFYRDLSVGLFQGKRITVASFVRNPMGANDNRFGSVSVFGTKSGSALVPVANYSTRLPGGLDIYIATLDVTSDETLLRVAITPAYVTNTAGGSTGHIYGITIAEGDIPALLETAGMPQDVENLYSPERTSIPFQSPGVPYSGTMTKDATGFAITGGTSVALGGTGVRGIVQMMLQKDTTYAFTWDRVVGATFGTAFVRNSVDGSGTTLATTTLDAELLFYTATATGVHTITFNGGSDDSALDIDQIELKASAVPMVTIEKLMSARNGDGSAIDITPASGKLSLSIAAASATRLITEAAQVTTKSGSALWEIVLPADYTTGGDFFVTVNAQIVGTSPNLGTRTVDLEAWKLSSAGAEGADICATAIKTLTTGAAADYRFTITGTTLAPGDRVRLKVSLVIQETGNVSPMQAAINSLRWQ